MPLLIPVQLMAHLPQELAPKPDGEAADLRLEKL